jgi:dCTP deaminase
MEESVILPQNNIYKDAAKSFVYSEIDKINSILNQNYPEFIKDKCNQIANYLNSGVEKIQDRLDLIEFKAQLYFVAELIDLFLTSNTNKSSWWAMALIKECYKKCEIDYTTRDILIIHYLNSKDYSVIPDLLSFSPIRELRDTSKPIDVFVIPSEAKHDIASIALLGHEVGHIYWKQNYAAIVKVIEETFNEQYLNKNVSLFDLEDLKTKRDKIASHIEEFLCDKIGRFLLGPAFDFALTKLFIASQNNQNSNTHPPEKIRIEQSLASLKTYKSNNKVIQTCFTNLVKYFEQIEDAPNLPFPPNKDDDFSQKLAELIHSTSNFQNGYDLTDIEDKWNEIRPELDAFRPPFEKVSRESPKSISPIDAIIVTSLYYYGEHYKLSNDYYRTNSQTDTKESIVRAKLVDHLRYAISLHEFVSKAQSKYFNENFKIEEMKTTLWEMRDRKVGGKLNPFVITPSINPKSQYSSTSVDLRLGNSFLIHKTTGFTHIAPEPKLSIDGKIDKVPLDAFYDELFIPVGKEFILHPHQFVLAATLEYVSVPFDFYALVLGRSSWGRLGLNIATATTVHAGYRGCITLELRNLGETPLPLKVGLRIAQLCLIPVPIEESTEGYFATSGKYIGPVGPEIPKIKDDADWELLNDL